MTVGDPVATLPVAGCRCVRISPDGTTLVTIGGGTVAARETLGGRTAWSRAWETPAAFPAEAVWGRGGDTVTLLTGERLALLDAMTGAELMIPAELATRRDVTALALSHSGVTLAVGTREGVVCLWQQDTGQVTRLRGGVDPVTALAWAPNGDELCVARPRSVQFWEREAMISSIDVGDTNPLRLAWAPDGDLIATSGLLDVRMISVSTRSESAEPLAMGGLPRGLGFSRSGSDLLVGRPDGSVELLDRRLRRRDVRPVTIPAALDDPAGLHVNEAGLVAVRSGETTVTLVRLADTELPSAERRTAVALRRWAADAARTVGRVAHDATPPPVPDVIAQRSDFAWAEDGWFTHDDEGRVARHHGDGRVRWRADAGPGSLSAAGAFLAVGGERRGFGPTARGKGARTPGRVTVLDAETGARVAVVAGDGRPALAGHAGAGHALAVTAPRERNRRAVDLLVHDAAWTGHRTVPVGDGAGEPAWSPDGSLLAAPVAGGVVLWDGQSLARVRRLELGSARVGVIAWSPDGTRLAVDHPDGPVTVWSTRTWEAVTTLDRSPTGGNARVLAWSPDSRLLTVPSPSLIGAVDLWDVDEGRTVLTVPPPPEGSLPVTAVEWAADGRFAVVYDDGTVVRWNLSLPPAADGGAPLPHPAPVLAALASGAAMAGATVSLALLADLMSLLLGQEAGPLTEFSGHPGITSLRGLRWPPGAVAGLAVLVAAGMPADEDRRPPDDAAADELSAAVERALDGRPAPPGDYRPAIDALRAELDRVDDSVVVLATLIGPEAVTAAPDLLARVRGRSFGGWSLTPRQRRLLGLRSLPRSSGSSQGLGVGDTRAGIARGGELPSLLPSQLALPRTVLAAKKSRDELLFRTRLGEFSPEGQPVVVILDDTPAACGAVGLTLRLAANLLTSVATRRHRRCALVSLGSSQVRFLTGMADLVHVWTGTTVERADLPAALKAARAAAAQLSDPIDGLPRLVLLTHAYLPCPPRPGLHVVRVRYPGVPAEDSAPRTHMLAPTADPEELQRAIGEILSDRS